MVTQSRQETKNLHEEDFVLWVDETVRKLRKRDTASLDWEHLIEEIEGLGIEQKHKVDSYLLQLLIHLLIYRYWESEKEWCQKGGKNEIDNFRVQLELLFESKTLYNYFVQRIDFIYLKARRRAITKTELQSKTFPSKCPFTVEQILDAQFFPE